MLESTTVGDVARPPPPPASCSLISVLLPSRTRNGSSLALQNGFSKIQADTFFCVRVSVVGRFRALKIGRPDLFPPGSLPFFFLRPFFHNRLCPIFSLSFGQFPLPECGGLKKMSGTKTIGRPNMSTFFLTLVHSHTHLYPHKVPPTSTRSKGEADTSNREHFPLTRWVT